MKGEQSEMNYSSSVTPPMKNASIFYV